MLQKGCYTRLLFAVKVTESLLYNPELLSLVLSIKLPVLHVASKPKISLGNDLEFKSTLWTGLLL